MTVATTLRKETPEMHHAMAGALALLLGLAAAVPVFGQSIDDLDVDGNDEISFSELLISYPAVTTNEFLDMDTDGDDALNEQELEAAREDGMIPDENAAAEDDDEDNGNDG